MIGVFDSGVGGLSVLRALWQELPRERFIYLADQAHVPYGPRPLEEVRSFSVEVTRCLLSQGARLIVVACNAASAAALHHLREVFPETPFVGMEPAVKPAVQQTRSGRVGVLATPATFQGALYASVVERFAHGVELLQHTCPGLVAQIEAGQLDAPETRRILEDALLPMLAQGIDTVVLGCTHYPFVIPLIEQIAGPQVQVIDPAPAVARQARRVLETRGLAETEENGTGNQPGQERTTFLTTGKASALQAVLPQMLGVQARVSRMRWKNSTLAASAGAAHQASALRAPKS